MGSQRIGRGAVLRRRTKVQASHDVQLQLIKAMGGCADLDTEIHILRPDLYILF